MKVIGTGKVRVVGKLSDSRVRVVGVDVDAAGLELTHDEYIKRLEAGESIEGLTGVVRRGDRTHPKQVEGDK